MAELKDTEFKVTKKKVSKDEIITELNETIDQLKNSIIQMGVLAKQSNDLNQKLSDENKELKIKNDGLEKLCWEYQKLLNIPDDDILAVAQAVGMAR